MSSTKNLADRQVLNKQTMGINEGLPLQVSDGGIEDLRRDIQRLMDIEAIKKLKHAYFRCVDTANMTEMAEVLHADIAVHYQGGSYEWKLQGREEVLGALAESFHSQAIGQHNGHMPEIQMLSETEATGIWYLHDNMWTLNHNHYTQGTALYWDRYVKEGGQWTIIETNYERLYEISQQIDGLPGLASHYLAGHGKKV